MNQSTDLDAFLDDINSNLRTLHYHFRSDPFAQRGTIMWSFTIRTMTENPNLPGEAGSVCIRSVFRVSLAEGVVLAVYSHPDAILLDRECLQSTIDGREFTTDVTLQGVDPKQDAVTFRLFRDKPKPEMMEENS